MTPVHDMTHLECRMELQDAWISEEEFNSVEFDAIFSRYSLDEIRAELEKRRTSK